MSSLRALLIPAIACAASTAAAMPFEAVPRVGGGGYVAGTDTYDPGLALNFSVGLRPLDWLTAHVFVDMMTLSPVPDPPFSLEDASGLLLVYGLESGFVLWSPGDFEVLGAVQVGVFDQAVTGSEGFSEVRRSISGAALGASVDGWYRLMLNVSIGARVAYRHLLPTSRCDSIGDFEFECEDLPDAGGADALMITAGVRLSI